MWPVVSQTRCVLSLAANHIASRAMSIKSGGLKHATYERPTQAENKHEGQTLGHAMSEDIWPRSILIATVTLENRRVGSFIRLARFRSPQPRHHKKARKYGRKWVFPYPVGSEKKELNQMNTQRQ